MSHDSLAFRIVMVALAGACGSLARWGTNHAVQSLVGPREPWHIGTMMINILGCFAFGALFVLLAPKSNAALILLTGFLGAYTTFSAFAFDTYHLIVADRLVDGLFAATLNVAIHVGLGLVALVLGMALGRAVF